MGQKKVVECHGAPVEQQVFALSGLRERRKSQKVAAR